MAGREKVQKEIVLCEILADAAHYFTAKLALKGSPYKCVETLLNTSETSQVGEDWHRGERHCFQLFFLFV